MARNRKKIGKSRRAWTTPNLGKLKLKENNRINNLFNRRDVRNALQGRRAS